MNQVFGLHDADLAPVREQLAAHKVDFMSISGHEARLLQFFIKAFRVRKVVEVGTLFGFSALCMAKALPEDGRVITLEKNPENWRIAQATFQAASSVSHKVTALCGDANELLAKITKEGPFDLVFIDANKGGYVDYLDWAEQNVRTGGLIVGDNTFLWGGVWDEPSAPDAGPTQMKVMKEFNLRLANASRYNSIIIPTTEGMTVAQKLF